jgi:hypothetical protein
MKFPNWLQGLLFAPALVALLFLLKATCPAPTGVGCFADPFIKPVFLPLIFLYKTYGQTTYILEHEVLIIILYWAVVGLLVGTLFDIKKK